MKEGRKCGILASEKKSYLGWLFYRLHRGEARQIFSVAARILRLRRIALLIGRIFLLLESGVLLVLILALLALLLPPLLLVALLWLSAASFFRRRAAALLAPYLAGRRVLLLDGFGMGEGANSLGYALDFSRFGYTVLLIGYPSGRRFLRQLGDGVWAVAPSLYFTLLARRFFSPTRILMIL